MKPTSRAPKQPAKKLRGRCVQLPWQRDTRLLLCLQPAQARLMRRDRGRPRKVLSQTQLLLHPYTLHSKLTMPSPSPSPPQAHFSRVAGVRWSSLGPTDRGSCTSWPAPICHRRRSRRSKMSPIKRGARKASTHTMCVGGGADAWQWGGGTVRNVSQLSIRMHEQLHPTPFSDLHDRRQGAHSMSACGKL